MPFVVPMRIHSGFPVLPLLGAGVTGATAIRGICLLRRYEEEGQRENQIHRQQQHALKPSHLSIL